MAEPSETSSSSPPASKLVKAKPVVVRVKRKATQERIDAFWLEISERPLKKPLLDLGSLSITDSSEKVLEESRTKKLLVQHVETISPTHAVKDVLKSILPDSHGSHELKRKIEERRSMLKPDRKQDKLRSIAKKEHEDLVRNARFEQIWKSRRETRETADDSFREICHLYDVVRVDAEDGNPGMVEESNHVPVEDNAILCNYLPLLREFLPSAAEEIESDVMADMMTYKSTEDNYVYDLYTVDDGANGTEEGISAEYPLVQVNDDDDYYDGGQLSDYETDDSNAEDNPINDYPDEESSEEERDPLDDMQDSDSQYEDEVVDVEKDEENWR